MDDLAVHHTFRVTKTMGFPKLYRDKDIHVAFEVPPETIMDWKRGRFRQILRLLKHLDQTYGGIDKFQLYLINDENSPPFEMDKGTVHINVPKWYAHFNKISKVLDRYKLSKYHVDLYKECFREGLNKFFTNTDPEEIRNDIDKTMFVIIEKMLSDFDKLQETEQKALLSNIENSKAGTILYEKIGKLDKSSPKVQLKSVLANVDKLDSDEVRDLLNTIFRSKKSFENFKAIGKLPIEVQTQILSNSEQAAHLLRLYTELETSLKDFKALIKERAESKNKDEKSIHTFLAANWWLLGIEYVNQVIKTDINPQGEKTGATYQKQWRIYPDFEIHKIDGSIHKCVVMELEEANDKIFNKDKSLSKEVLDGLFQTIAYTIFHHVEKDKPTKGVAVLGYTGNLDKNQQKKLERLSNMFPHIEIKTYDQLIKNAENTIAFLQDYLEQKKALN